MILAKKIKIEVSEEDAKTLEAYTTGG